jgi:hypothetical protein
MTNLYRVLVALHPRSFRIQFGPEMELIFRESGRPVALLADALISLARQWLVRSQLCILSLAAIGGLIPFVLGFGIVRMAGGTLGPPRHLRRAPVHAINTPATEPFVMLTAVIAILFISGTMLFAITWFRYSQRLQSRQLRRS